MATVSVIIPTYNRAYLVTNTVESVLSHIGPHSTGCGETVVGRVAGNDGD